MLSRSSIVIRYEIPGFHQWKDAPEIVSFLRERHRHNFKFTVTMNVDFNDRELEFFIVKDELIKTTEAMGQRIDGGIDFGNLSCESIAMMILEHVRYYFNRKAVKVEVSEDGENSGMVEWSLG